MNQIEMQLEIKSGNEAFSDSPQGEIARLLRHTANKIESGVEEGKLMDVNGNKVGMWWVDIESDELECGHCQQPITAGEQVSSCSGDSHEKCRVECATCN